MTQALPTIPVQVLHNPLASPGIAYGDKRRRILNRLAFAEAQTEITSWPGYAPTPLRRLDGVAAATHVAEIHYKDEGGRFGLGSFKALGGAYAVGRLLTREIPRVAGIASISTEELRNGSYRNITEGITVTCATDGNHGRSVAWGARLFGCRCVIYIHATVSQGREQAIARYGAQVVRTSGHYDDAIRQAAQDAQRYGRFVVSDTSYEGYMDIPKDVMQGYTLMAEEVMQQLAQTPTHIFVQGGVGGMAAAICAHFWERYGAKRPRFVVVEPDIADCIYRSIQHGEPTPAEGNLDTVMAGLACGEISLLAWEILREGADDVMTVNDQAAIACMRLLAMGYGGDAPLVAGESAVAGLAGFIGAAQQAALRDRLGISQASRILLFGSEGATDPEVYQALVGHPPEQVEREQ